MSLFRHYPLTHTPSPSPRCDWTYLLNTTRPLSRPDSTSCLGSPNAIQVTLHLSSYPLPYLSSFAYHLYPSPTSLPHHSSYPLHLPLYPTSHHTPYPISRHPPLIIDVYSFIGHFPLHLPLHLHLHFPSPLSLALFLALALSLTPCPFPCTCPFPHPFPLPFPLHLPLHFPLHFPCSRHALRPTHHHPQRHLPRRAHVADVGCHVGTGHRGVLVRSVTNPPTPYHPPLTPFDPPLFHYTSSLTPLYPLITPL